MAPLSGRGFSLVEALIVAGILAALGIPILGLIFAGSREGALSEDFMFAEVLASRYIEEWSSQPFHKLDALVPRKMVTAGGASMPVPGTGGTTHREALKTPEGFDARLELARVKDGLLSLEVTISWQVPRERGARRFALFRLKSNPNLGLEGKWKL
ncbi:MAG: hypothetical protein HY815_19800 [Candidatus Riflebacteria bacterium]|nr:hypothetical protein [Candidatus Riflebacteria bacterium]